MLAYLAAGCSSTLHLINDNAYIVLRVDPPIVTRPAPRNQRIEQLLLRTPSVTRLQKS